MTSWRLIVLALLVLVPAVAMVGLGAYALWLAGWLGWVWWLLPLFWGVAWLLARRWKKKLLAAVPAEGVPVHWTRRDEQALQIVQAKQAAGSQLSANQLIDPSIYFHSAIELSHEIARHYHPHTSDPVGSLTVPEILAAGHLALEDMELWVQQYVPGSHLVTVDHLRMLSKAPRYYDLLTNISWAASIIANPMANIPRFLVSRSILTPASNELQENVLNALYSAFLARVGRYCIEMNSGRLRGGAARFREAMARVEPAALPIPIRSPEAVAVEPAAAAISPPPVEKQRVTIAIVGQVKAGKSSLVNALLGGRQAKVDVLPETRDVRRYRLESSAEAPEELFLLDTPGYNEAGATAAQDRETREAVRQADLVLLVLDAKSPARKSDVEFVRALAAWLKTQPQLKIPPVLAVLTHIDLLSPALEWLPPYDWQEPKRPKEQAIAAAVDYNAQQLGEHVDGAIPVCTDGERERVYGVTEWLLPAMSAELGEARACAVIRALHADIDSGRVKSVFRQFANAGRGLIKSLLASRN